MKTYTADEITAATITPAALGRAVGSEFLPKPYLVYPWLLHMEREIINMLYRPGPEILIVSVPPQQGKALAVETPVPTPTGWSTMGALLAGDQVIGHDGNPVRVMEAFDPYDAELWRVTFEDGSELLADGEHSWSAVSRDVAAYRQGNHAWGADWPEVATTAPTSDLAVRQHRPDGGARWRVPVGLIRSRNQELPIDPYVLGYWLGDGTTAEPSITVSKDDYPGLALHLASAGHTWSRADHGSTYRVRLLGARHHFTSLGILGDKHIPDMYLRAGTQQRLWLLAGLMDSDGGMSGSTSEIAQQSKVLAGQIEELAVSLGAVVRTSERPSRLNGRDTGATTYRQKITAPFNPFRLSRKRDLWESQATRARWAQRSQRTIRSIEPTGVTSRVRCIRVESEAGLFLAGRSMIPTHNSTYCSMFLPAWYLGRHPGHQVINISYNETQAKKWGLRTLRLMQKYGDALFGATVDPSSDSAADWKMTGGFGGMMSAGIRGGITGNPGDLILLDDTLKGREEANSPTIKKKNLEEWHDSVSTRFQENTKVLLVATRWAEDDLSGEILTEARQPGYSGFPVTELNIKAIAEPDPDERKQLDALDRENGIDTDDPESHRSRYRDCLGRSEGQHLQGQHSKTFFLMTRDSRPAPRWNALYQGTPTAGADGMFPEEAWRFWCYNDYDGRPPETAVLPELSRTVRVWDLAASEGDGDWTVGTKIGRDSQGRFFILDRQRFRHAPGEVMRLVKETARIDGYTVPIRIERERSGAGITVVDDYKRELLGYDVDGMKAEGDKTQRAGPYSRLQNAHAVHLPVDADWIDDWTGRHAQMDGKGALPRFDDEIDTASYGCIYLLDGGDTILFDPSSIGRGRDLTPEQEMELMLVREQLGLGY